MSTRTVDAVVIGAGPNGLVAANALVDAGWDVLVLEEQDARSAGRSGPPRSPPRASATTCSARSTRSPPRRRSSASCTSSSTASPGCAPRTCWRTRSTTAAPPSCTTTRDETAAGLDDFAPATATRGSSWSATGSASATRSSTRCSPRSRRSCRARSCSPGPASPGRSTWPGSPSCRCAGWGASGSAARADPLLLTGNAMHADVPPDAAGSGIFGWLLAMLGQDVGFPVPQGGAGRLADALAARVAVGRRRRGDAVPGSRRSRSPADGPWASAPRTARSCGPGGPCSPTSRRLRSTATSSGCSTCPTASGATSTASSGTTRRSR